MLDGLEHGYVEHDGSIFSQPRREIRPGPPRSFAGEHLARTKGYEHHATGAAAPREHGLDPGREALAQRQIAGTPV